MTDSNEDALELDEDSSQCTPKPLVTSVPEGTVKRIFGTSRVFQDFDKPKSKLKGLTVHPRVREYYFQGQTCLEQGEWETAILFFSRALHLDPMLVDFYLLRAEAYIQLCDFSSAAQNLRRAYSFEPENIKYQEQLSLVLHLQGQCLFEQCAYQDALHVFSQASELQPQKACFRYRCMACLLALKRHQDCLTLVNKELKYGTTNADVYILRARLYNFFQKPSLCYRDLHNSLLLEPSHPQAKALLKTMVNQAQKARQEAGIFALQGKIQPALQCISLAIENSPLDASLFLFRGTMYRRLQEFDGAVEDLLKALDMVPENQEDLVQQVQRQLLLAYNDFAVHCYMQGAYQESLLLLNKVLRDEQQEKGLYINRGDCFFQLENLAYAEADYQQALALNPEDPGAKVRMSLLQEKMGIHEQRRRQFNKAENHFSVAIQYSPQKARYYLQRARSRYLLQNILGARQDVATALLLEPDQPKLLPLMTSLFLGMSVNDVLNSHVAHLARLQLKRAVENSLQSSIPKDIVGLLRDREIERQKARTLQREWKLEQPFSEKLKIIHQAPQEGPEEEAVTPEEKKEREEEPKHLPDKEMSVTSSYIDQASSGSILHFTATSMSETETSTISQYRSNSATTVTFSDSSQLKTQSSDSRTNAWDPRLSHSPIKNKAALEPSWRLTKTEDSQVPRHRPSKTKDIQGQRKRTRKTKQTQDSRQRPSKTEATHSPTRKPEKTEETQGPGQRSPETKVTPGPSQRPSKTEDTQGPRGKLREARAAWDRSRSRSKFPTHSHTWGLNRSSSKTKDFCDLSLSPSKTDVIQGGKQRPSKDNSTQDQNWKPSPNSSKTKVFYDPSQKPSNAEDTQGHSQRLSEIKDSQSQSLEPSSSPNKSRATHDMSHSPSKTKAMHSPSQSLYKVCPAPSWTQVPRQILSKIKVVRGLSRVSSKTEAMQGSSQSLPKAQSAQSWSQGPVQSPSKTQTSWSLSQSPSNTESIWGQAPNLSKTEDTWDLSCSPSKTEATQRLSQSPSKTKADWNSSPSF